MGASHPAPSQAPIPTASTGGRRSQTPWRGGGRGTGCLKAAAGEQGGTLKLRGGEAGIHRSSGADGPGRGAEQRSPAQGAGRVSAAEQVRVWRSFCVVGCGLDCAIPERTGIHEVRREASGSAVGLGWGCESGRFGSGRLLAGAECRRL